MFIQPWFYQFFCMELQNHGPYPETNCLGYKPSIIVGYGVLQGILYIWASIVDGAKLF